MRHLKSGRNEDAFETRRVKDLNSFCASDISILGRSIGVHVKPRFPRDIATKTTQVGTAVPVLLLLDRHTWYSSDSRRREIALRNGPEQTIRLVPSGTCSRLCLASRFPNHLATQSRWRQRNSDLCLQRSIDMERPARNGLVFTRLIEYSLCVPPALNQYESTPVSPVPYAPQPFRRKHKLGYPGAGGSHRPLPPREREIFCL